MVTVLLFLGTMLGAYLLGGVDTGIIISRLVYHDDVRNHGSGGAGMTNMLRTFGKKAAAMTALGDVCKGFVAVWLAGLAFAALEPQTGCPVLWGKYLAAVLAIIGHWKPVYFHFRGGKGVLVAAGGILALRPILLPMLLVIFLVCFLPTRMVSLGSVTVAVSYPILTALYGALALHLAPADLAVSIGGAVISCLLVLYMHRSNIQRIRDGKEYRFDGSHKKQ